MEKVEYNNENLMTITVTLGLGRINIISCYASDISKPRIERETFYEEVQIIINKIPMIPRHPMRNYLFWEISIQESVTYP